MPKNLIITTKWLTTNDACEEQVELFRRTFGERAVITPEIMAKHGAQFDLLWLAKRVLKDIGWVEFAAFDNACDSRWYKTEMRITNDHCKTKDGRSRKNVDWDAYDKAIDAAYKRFHKRTRKLQGELIMKLPRRASSSATYNFNHDDY